VRIVVAVGAGGAAKVPGKFRSASRGRPQLTCRPEMWGSICNEINR
jgi:hypothetical protein